MRSGLTISGMDFEIRMCRRSDFEGVLRLLQQLWPDQELDSGALRKVFEQGMQSKSQVYLCAEKEDDVIGFVSLTVKNNLWQAADLGHIDELVVDEKHRGSGLGTQILTEIVAQAKQRGCVRVELESAFHRKKAHAFYERQGFENRGYLFSKPIK
jgi:ribosomal protein S18 acetylase RimI-like enzyme